MILKYCKPCDRYTKKELCPECGQPCSVVETGEVKPSSSLLTDEEIEKISQEWWESKPKRRNDLSALYSALLQAQHDKSFAAGEKEQRVKDQEAFNKWSAEVLKLDAEKETLKAQTEEDKQEIERLKEQIFAEGYKKAQEELQAAHKAEVEKLKDMVELYEKTFLDPDYKKLWIEKYGDITFFQALKASVERK